MPKHTEIFFCNIKIRDLDERGWQFGLFSKPSINFYNVLDTLKSIFRETTTGNLKIEFISEPVSLLPFLIAATYKAHTISEARSIARQTFSDITSNKQTSLEAVFPLVEKVVLGSLPERFGNPIVTQILELKEKNPDFSPCLIEVNEVVFFAMANMEGELLIGSFASDKFLALAIWETLRKWLNDEPPFDK